MDILSDTVSTLSDTFKLKPLQNSNYNYYWFISIFLILYISLSKPKLPVIIRQLFDNSLVRFITLVFILYLNEKNPKNKNIILLMVIGFVFTMQVINKQKTEDMVDNIVNNIVNNQYNTESDKIIPEYTFNCDQYTKLISELELKKTEADVKCLTHDEQIKKIDDELNKTEEQIKGPLRCKRKLIECGKNQGNDCGVEYITCLKSIS